VDGYIVGDGCDEVCFRMALDDGVKLLRYVGGASAYEGNNKGGVSRLQWNITVVVGEWQVWDMMMWAGMVI
jgi:hypothetical protein